jgi:hypothetical protein
LKGDFDFDFDMPLQVLDINALMGIAVIGAVALQARSTALLHALNGYNHKTPICHAC